MHGKFFSRDGVVNVVATLLVLGVAWWAFFGPSDEPAPAAREPAAVLSDLAILARPATDTTTLVQTPTCEGGTIDLNAAEKGMLDLHNRARSERGIGPLCVSPMLTGVARSRSEDMLDRGYFEHETPEGTIVTDDIDELVKPPPGRAYLVGENIGKGGSGETTDTPERRFQGFMNSPGHRENVLRGSFSEVGIGAKSGSYQEFDDVTTIYTVNFGGWR